MRNLAVLDTVIDKPICIDNHNSVEFLDLSGSPLPISSLRITGL